MDIGEALNVLGLPPSATTAQIREAYRDLAKVWHPDRFGSDPKLRTKTEETMKRINEAYRFLQTNGPTNSTPNRNRSEESASGMDKRASSQAARPQARSSPPRNNVPTVRQQIPWWAYGLIALVIVGLLLASRNEKKMQQLPEPPVISPTNRIFVPPQAVVNIPAEKSTPMQKEYSLSADGKTMVFTHEHEPSDELWLADSSGSNQRLILKAQPDPDPVKNLSGFATPLLSLDGRRVYFISSAWVTSGAVHVLDLKSKTIQFLTSGNTLRLVRDGKYAGNLIVSKHKYFAGGGSYDFYWLISPQGEELMLIGPEQENVEEFVRLYK